MLNVISRVLHKHFHSHFPTSKHQFFDIMKIVFASFSAYSKFYAEFVSRSAWDQIIPNAESLDQFKRSIDLM